MLRACIDSTIRLHTILSQLVASSFIQLIRYSFGQAHIRSFLHSFIHSNFPLFSPFQTIKLIIPGEFINGEINVIDPEKNI